MAKIGDYVAANLINPGNSEGATRQGVYIQNNGDGTIQVQGELGTYHCLEDVTVFSDEDLQGPTLDHIQRVRATLGT